MPVAESESRNVVYWRKDKRRWLYQFAVPAHLQPVFAGRIWGAKGEPFERVYLKTAPRENTLAASRIAKAEAEPYLTRDLAVVAALEEVEPDQRPAKMADMLAAGKFAVLFTGMAAAPMVRPTDRDYAAFLDAKYTMELRQQVATAETLAAPLLLKAAPSPEFALGTGDKWQDIKSGLLAAYLTRKGDKWRGADANNSRHQDPLKRTLHRMVELFGNVDYRDITPKMAGQFRDHLETLGKSFDWRERELQHAHRLYAAAVDLRTMRDAPNPFEDLTPSGSAADDELRGKGKFSPRQIRAILDKAAAIKFGGERHEAAMHALRLVVYTGAAPNEALLIQRGDIYTDAESGVVAWDISQADCVTKKRHPLKSLKNTESRPRLMPLHPDLVASGFVDWAQNGDAQAFAFDAFPWNKHKYRRGWFDQSFMPELLAGMEHVGIKIIEEGGKRMAIDTNSRRGDVLAFYSLRHSMHDLIDNADMSRKRQEVLTGHASQQDHDNYASGANLAKLFDDVAKLNPLADRVLQKVDASPK